MVFTLYSVRVAARNGAVRTCVAKLSGTCAKQEGSFVRNAQAAEIFRSSFFLSKAQESSIPLEDLDQLVAKDRIRPSMLVNVLEVAGLGLGLVSRFAPSSIANQISESVDEATVQQFNDSIRDMQLNNVDNVDVKETLKYHRELRGGDAWDPPNSEEHPAEGTAGMMDAKAALTQVLYHTLKLSGKY